MSYLKDKNNHSHQVLQNAGNHKNEKITTIFTQTQLNACKVSVISCMCLALISKC